jgi:hypothetical protein
MDNLFDTKGNEAPTAAGTSSKAVITVQGVVGGVPIAVAGGGGGGTVDQGLPAVVGNAWPIKVTDGVDTAAVAPGGTPAAVGDPALVVTISPNTAPITAADASVGATGAAVPGFTQQNGGTDGANLRANRMFDLDSGAGAEFNLGVTLRASAPGGSVEAGTTANPLEIAAVSLPLPAGAATEATVAAILAELDVALSTRASEATLASILVQLSLALDVPLSTRASEVTAAAILAELDVALSTRAAATQLPAALVGGRLDENIGAWLGSTAPTVGQKAMAASIPVTLASDQPAIPVTGSFTNPSVGLNGAAAPGSTTQIGGPDELGDLHAAVVVPHDPSSTDEGLVVRNIPSGTQVVGLDYVSGNAVTTQAPGEQLVAVEGRAADGAAVTGNPVLIGGQDGTNAQSLLTDTSGRPNVVGAAAQGAAVAGNPVLIGAEDAAGNTQRLRTAALPPVGTTPGQVVRQVVAQTGAQSSVAGSAASVTLLAANVNRLGATLYNDSNKNFFVKLGATASNTSFTVRMSSQTYYEVPFGYTGSIDGIQDVANGNMRVTELT